MISKKLSVQILIVFTLLSYSSFSQVTVDIRVKHSKTAQARLYLINGDNEILIDSTRQVDSGKYVFNLKPDYSYGIYKMALGKNISFNFIVADEPVISLETLIYTPEDSLKSIVSDENKLYFDYQRIKQKSTRQIWLLNSLKDFYNDSSMFDQMIEDELYKVKNYYNQKVQSLARLKGNLFTSSLILLEQRPLPPPFLNAAEQKEYTIQFFWNDCNLMDNRLITLSALNKKLWDYIELHFNDQLDKEEQDSAFIRGIDYLLNLNMSSNIKEYIRNAIYEELFDTDYRIVAEHLKRIYPDTKSNEEDRFDFVEHTPGDKFKVGELVPDFKVLDKRGRKIRVSKIESKYKLILFWASWCPHCTETLPEIQKIYKTYKNDDFEIISVAIDDEGQEWKKIIENHNYIWINTHEPDNGENKLLQEYGINETPEMFLVDKNLKVISLPSTAKQVLAKLRKML